MSGSLSLPRVLADTPLPSPVSEMLEGKVSLVPWQGVTSATKSHVEGIYTYGHPRVDGPLLASLEGVRVISNHGVGVDHIDIEEATHRKIPVGNTPGVLDGATADMAFTLLLAAARRIIEGDQFARGASFTHYDPSLLIGLEVHGKTIGIIGMGRIGLQVAMRATGFGMEILYHNRRIRNDLPTGLRAEYTSLFELLGRSDFVVVCVPLEKDTHQLIDAKCLSRMKSSAILINVARGGVIDTDALTEALDNRIIHAAALDVTDPEPLPRDHPLLKSSQVIISPHLGSATKQTRLAMAELSVANLMLGLEGKPLIHQVNQCSSSLGTV